MAKVDVRADIQRCEDCGAFLTQVGFETTCPYCGLVANDLSFGKTTSFEKGDQNHPTLLDGNCYTFFKETDVNDEKRRARFRHLKKQDKYTANNSNRPYYLRFLREIVDYFGLSKQIMTSTIYLFKKIQRYYNIPPSQKIHISLLITSLLCITSSPSSNHFIPLKQLLNYCEMKGHRMKLKYIYSIFKRYPLFMEYYTPSSVHNRIRYFRVAIFSQFIDHHEIKAQFNIHDFSITYEEYVSQLQITFNEIMAKIYKSLKTQSRNPHRLCCGVLYIANTRVTKQNNTIRFLTQHIFGNVLNVSAVYIRDGVCEVNKLLKE